MKWNTHWSMGYHSSFQIILKNKKKKFHFRSTPQRKWKNSLSHCCSQASYCNMLAKLTSCRMNWIGTITAQKILIYKCRTVESNCSSMLHADKPNLYAALRKTNSIHKTKPSYKHLQGLGGFKARVSWGEEREHTHFWMVRQAIWNTNVCCAGASKEMRTTAIAALHCTHLSRSDGAFSPTPWPLSSGTAQKLLFLIPQRTKALWTVIWLCHSSHTFTQDKQQGWEQL